MDQIPEVEPSPPRRSLLGPALAYLLPAAAFALLGFVAVDLQYFCAIRPGPYLPDWFAIGLAFSGPYAAVLGAFHRLAPESAGERIAGGIAAFLVGGMLTLFVAGVDGDTLAHPERFLLAVGTMGLALAAAAAMLGALLLEVGLGIARLVRGAR